MCEHEYTALIPAHELRQVRALLRTVHARRGWATELAHQDAAWAAVLAAARTQEGGGWPDDLAAAQLLPARLAALSMAIDRLLLGGQLQQWLLDRGAAPLGFAVVQEAPGPDDWISYFDERANRVVLRQQRWEPAALAVTEERPMSCEGVLCTSNLQVGAKGGSEGGVGEASCGGLQTCRGTGNAAALQRLEERI